MKSSKWILGLMAFVLIVALAPSSFAQVQISILNTPSAQEIQTARNAQTADVTSVGAGILVSGALIANSPLTTTQLTIQFPAPITASPAVVDGTFGGGALGAIPTGDPIQIQGASGLFASITAVATVDFKNSTIVITLPGFGTSPNTLSGTFRLVGVRIDVNGKTAPLTATASLGSSANNYLMTATNTVTLISALGPGIASLTQSALPNLTNQGAALMFTNQTNATFADNKATVVIGEGFASAWRTDTQVSVTGAPVGLGTLIRLTINGLPSGVTAVITAPPAVGPTVVVFVAPSATSGGTTQTSATLDNTNPGTSNVTFLQFKGTSLSTVESMQLEITLGGVPTGTLSPGSITLTATMAPVANASANGTPSQSQPNNGVNPSLGTQVYPRFAALDVGPLTIGTITSANTTALIPYAVRVGAYDTGIAIANTTSDPFTPGTGGATKANGTLIITLFPRTATGADTPFTITTSSTVRPGVGLATDGTLVAGGVWTALVSDILTAAGKTGDFFGYIFIQANFLNAHGAAYIFNGAGFTSATPVLLLSPPAQSSRSGPFVNGAETLGF